MGKRSDNNVEDSTEKLRVPPYLPELPDHLKDPRKGKHQKDS